jgi:hypothetical protein
MKALAHWESLTVGSRVRERVRGRIRVRVRIRVIG